MDAVRVDASAAKQTRLVQREGNSARRRRASSTRPGTHTMGASRGAMCAARSETGDAPWLWVWGQHREGRFVCGGDSLRGRFGGWKKAASHFQTVRKKGTDSLM